MAARTITTMSPIVSGPKPPGSWTGASVSVASGVAVVAAWRTAAIRPLAELR